MGSKVFISLFIVFAMAATAMLPLSLYDNGNVNAAGEYGSDGNPFLISTVKDLSKVGKGAANPEQEYKNWDQYKHYKLTQNIEFDPNDPEHNTNDGIEIGLEIRYDEGNDEFTVILDPDGSVVVNSLYIWIGTEHKSFTSSFQGTIAAPSDAGTYTMTIGGTHSGDGGTFAYAVKIDMTDVTNGWTTGMITFDSNGNFDPICNSSIFFGTFDGDGYAISGMNTAVFDISSDSVFAGLFGRIYDGTVKNIGMIEGYSICVSKSAYAGSIAGRADAVISNCYNTGNVTAASMHENYSTAYAGGITGYAGYRSSSLPSSISNCYNTGNVTATANVTATVSGSPAQARAGGIVGYSISLISNCYNTGNVASFAKYGNNTETWAGGIAGHHSLQLISNCYNTGNVTAVPMGPSTYIYKGGIAGQSNAQIISSYFLKQDGLNLVGHNSYSGDMDGSGGKTKDDMTTGWENTFIGWNFNCTWGMDPYINDGFPILRTFQFELFLEFEGNGSISGPVNIYGGNKAVVTIVADSGNKIGTVTDNGNDVTDLVSDGKYIITSTLEDRTVKVVFVATLVPSADSDIEQLSLVIIIIILTTITCTVYFFGLRKLNE